MKRIFSLVLAVLMLAGMLPLGAMAEGAIGYPVECGTPGHHSLDGLDHNRPQSCWVKGHNYCDGLNHERAACGKWGHYNCDGKTHAPSDCGADGHFACDKLAHGQAACGLADHCVSDGKKHAQAICGIQGHFKCDGMQHKAAVCGVAGHMGCDGQNHTGAACGKWGHYNCDGEMHAKAECSRSGHCISDGLTHAAAPCGHAGHFLCDGRKHVPAACGVEGHFACETRAHQHKPVSKYCNAVPQHMVCQGDAQHYCDPAQGGCGKTYLCSRSNAHTACRMCGLLWCDRTLGSHETPCNNANHRPCVYTLEGRKYVRADHETCVYCGKARCTRSEHGNGKCCPTCPNCGGPEKLGVKHFQECGHYWCGTDNHTLPCGHFKCRMTKIPHRVCPAPGCGRYICDGHSHLK